MIESIAIDLACVPGRPLARPMQGLNIGVAWFTGSLGIHIATQAKLIMWVMYFAIMLLSYYSSVYNFLAHLK